MSDASSVPGAAWIGVVAVDVALSVLIILVQTIIYPSFLRCDPSRFAAWHVRYMQRISWVVIPLMLAQVALHGWRIMTEPAALTWVSAGLIGVAWLSTFAWSVPIHRRLTESGYDQQVIAQLIRSNLPRCLAWCVVAGVTVAQAAARF